jgi:hypothetical protein
VSPILSCSSIAWFMTVYSHSRLPTTVLKREVKESLLRLHMRKLQLVSAVVVVVAAGLTRLERRAVAHLTVMLEATTARCGKTAHMLHLARLTVQRMMCRTCHHHDAALPAYPRYQTRLTRLHMFQFYKNLRTRLQDFNPQDQEGHSLVLATQALPQIKVSALACHLIAHVPAVSVDSLITTMISHVGTSCRGHQTRL